MPGFGRDPSVQDPMTSGGGLAGALGQFYQNTPVSGPAFNSGGGPGITGGGSNPSPFNSPTTSFTPRGTVSPLAINAPAPVSTPTPTPTPTTNTPQGQLMIPGADPNDPQYRYTLRYNTTYSPLGGYNLPNGSNGQASGWSSPWSTNAVPGTPPQPSGFQDYMANNKNFGAATVGGGTQPWGINAIAPQTQAPNPYSSPLVSAQPVGNFNDRIYKIDDKFDPNQFLQQLFSGSQGGFNSWGNPMGGNPFAFQTGQQSNGLNPLMSMLFGGGFSPNTLGYNQFQQNNPLAGGGFNLGSLLSIINNLSQMQYGNPGMGAYNGNFFSNFY